MVLAILGILTGAAAPMLGRPQRPSDTELARKRVAEARARAVSTGRSVVVVEHREVGPPFLVLARPDGSVLGAEPLGIERFSGHLSPGAQHAR